jgi:GNAT superfamily N-acetyltransferase
VIDRSIRIEALSEQNADAWNALFVASNCSCFCHYWHFEGSKNEWLARCAEDREHNRQQQVAGLRDGALDARGLLAMRDGAAVGWMKLTPRACLAKLRRQGAYRNLDLGEDEGIWSIGCFLVHPAARRLGVARALALSAEHWVRAWGGRAIEAYPHRIAHPLHDEEAWMGPEAIFRAADWTKVHDCAPYPVYRKNLEATWGKQPVSS